MMAPIRASVMTVESNYSDPRTSRPVITDENRRTRRSRCCCAPRRRWTSTAGRRVGCPMQAIACRRFDATSSLAAAGARAPVSRASGGVSMSELSVTALRSSPAATDDVSTTSSPTSRWAVARGCNGCGDHAILTAMQRLRVAEQLERREHRVRLGHRMLEPVPARHQTYGFHGIHGRALPGREGREDAAPRPEGLRQHRRRRLPIASARRTGCTGSGTTWRSPSMLLDNRIYGLTKKQNRRRRRGLQDQHEPTGRVPSASAQPALGDARCGQRGSFVAQTVDPVPRGPLPGHLRGVPPQRGCSFVRVIQELPRVHARAPSIRGCRSQRTMPAGAIPTASRRSVELVTQRTRNQRDHDPRDLASAREVASVQRHPPQPWPRTSRGYEDTRHAGAVRTAEQLPWSRRGARELPPIRPAWRKPPHADGTALLPI